MINRIQSSDPSFRAARVNILATSDNHGNLMRLPRFMKTIENNAKEIFPKAGDLSTANFFTIVGDWFINPSKKGFITFPELSNGDFQNLALIKTIDAVRELVNKMVAKAGKVQAHEAPNLEVLYTLGNHCLDGGTKFMMNVMRKDPMKTLVTNVDMDKSPAVVEAMNTCDKIVKSAVYSIPDDKNPDLIHKILFLGVTIPSMDFYNPGLCEGLEFFDNSNKKDANLKEEDIQGTIKVVKDEVEAFKKENPKGAVILLSHMGNRLSEMVQKNVPEIDHILNGHDHKNVQSSINGHSITSLGKDNELIKALNLEFDDDGNLAKITVNPFFTETTVADGLENHEFQKFLNEYFEKDLEPLINLSELKAEPKENVTKEQVIEQYTSQVLEGLGITDPNITEKLMQNKNFKELISAEAIQRAKEDTGVKKGLNKLTYGNEIRYQNSYLMNYLTSAIKRTVRDKLNEDVFTVAIQSSIVRGGLEDGSNNMKVMKVFDGVSEDLSNLRIGDVKGDELVGLIVENILANLKAPTRNTIIHWSDVQVNRTLIEAIKNGTSNAKYSDAIRVRNPKTKQFEPIDLNESYRMVIGEKFLVKDDIEWPGRIRDRFVSLNKTYDQLFKEYIASVDYKLHITPKTKEQRIL